MNLQPQVSVVIPHLNEAENLRRCLQSLAAQRTEGIPFEVIVVDNGSRDMPQTVCAEFPGVRLELEPVPGPGPARNRGASLARGEIIAFIDADCVADPGWMRSIASTMRERPDIDLVGGDIGILMTDANRPTSIEAYESIYSYRAREYVEKHGFAATGNMAVRTDVFRSVGPFGGITTMEDTEWGQRATSSGHSIKFLPDAKVFTPSCKSFEELAVRWDRHVAHEFRKVGSSYAAKMRWLVYGAAIAASPIAECAKCLRSDSISGTTNRIGALACLTRVRLYRARRMMGLLFQRNAVPLVENWNREKG